MINDAIEYGLRVGCNSSFIEMVQSSDFNKLIAFYSQLSARFLKGTDEGTALRTGHLNMGRLLNTLPETEAITEAQKLDGSGEENSNTRAMIHGFGQALIKAAEKCLPPEVIEMARQWKDCDAEEQIKIARNLYFIFRSQEQEPKGDITIQSVYEDIDRRLCEVDDERNILPGLYGKWDKEKCLANCQGKTQMLAAFGRLAGAQILCASPIRQSGYELEIARSAFTEEVVRDLAARGLGDADASFAEGISASYIKRQFMPNESFHVSTALELCDGRWVLIDPHGLAWGVFPDIWNLGETCRLLKKYASVLPGLALIRHDNGLAKKSLAKRMEEAQDLIRRSQRMEETLKSAEVLGDLIRAVIASDDLDLLIANEHAEKGETAPNLSNKDVRFYVAAVLVMGGENSLFDFEKFIDPSILPARIKSWLTWYHASALNMFREQLSDSGQLIHPVCEFGLPDYYVAISAINSLCWRLPGRRSSEEHRFFIENSFDQVSLFNALSDRALGQAAACTLKALPFMHSTTWRKMRMNHL